MTTEKPITNGSARSLARFNLWLVLALALTLWILNLHLNLQPPAMVLPQPVAFPATAGSETPPPVPTVFEIPTIESQAAALNWTFSQLAYNWPLPAQPQLPRFYLQHLPRDLGKLDVRSKKALFFRLLLPMVAAENQQLTATRTQLIELFLNGSIAPTSADASKVQALFNRYRVEGEINDLATRTELLRRLDTLPTGLVLAQAALESGWGSSRFSQQGNNLFGIWTWDGEGLVPFNRPSGSTHRVKSYGDLRGSIKHYLHTLNTGKAYRRLRQLRAYQRLGQQPLDPILLAGGLVHYSARGETYVGDIRRLIHSARLQWLPTKFSWIGSQAIIGCSTVAGLNLPPADCS